MKQLSKTILVGTISAVSFFGATTTVQANEIDRLVLSLCEAAQNDDRRVMRKKLETARLRLNNIYDSIKCGGEGSLLRVATTSGSLNAAKFIATKISKDSITQPESDGKNIIEYSQALVTSGDSTKQAFVELYQSKI